MTPSDRRYAETHEWVKIEDGIATVGISDYAQHFGPWRFCWISERDDRPLKPLTWNDMDGVIGTNALNLETVKRAGLPSIIICTNEPKCSGSISVTTDVAVLSQVATKHFLDRGFSNFAFYGSTPGTYEQRREQAFRVTVGADPPRPRPPRPAIIMAWGVMAPPRPPAAAGPVLLL